MKDESIDDVLFNIGPDIKEQKDSQKENAFPKDSQFKEEICIDLEPLGDDDEAEENQKINTDDISDKKISDVKSNIETLKSDPSPKPADQNKNTDKPAAEASHGISMPSVKFTIKGSRTWNVREPYIINIINDRLKENYDDLARTIFFVDSPENESSIQGKIKLSLLRNISGDTKELISRYKEFLYRLIIHITDELSETHSLKGDKQKLFIYHTGVYTIYRILVGNLQNNKIGHCYKRLPDNKVIKFMPSEYIKVAILNWFEDNINIFNLPFDGIHEFNELKRIVTGKYYIELEKYNKKLDEIIIKLKLNTDKKFNREEYMRNKWDEWFGTVNIIVYNRFIERTIFKFSERHVHR